MPARKWCAMSGKQLSPMGTAVAPSRGSVRARLLTGVSSLALPAAALALGVSLATEARAQTVIPNQSATYNLNPANNPFRINSGTTLNAAAGDAIDGSNAVQWTLTNNGSVTGNQSGINLQSQSTVTNAGSITGTNK
ncbi:MAG TPA: hypothetical protein VGZ01_07175, partial [Trinickia sp.]|nr:hypothetical protein [Trinickia sp.]